MRSTRRANLWSMPSGSFCLLLRLACLSRTVSWIRGVDTLSALSRVYWSALGRATSVCMCALNACRCTAARLCPCVVGAMDSADGALTLGGAAQSRNDRQCWCGGSGPAAHMGARPGTAAPGADLRLRRVMSLPSRLRGPPRGSVQFAQTNLCLLQSKIIINKVLCVFLWLGAKEEARARARARAGSIGRVAYPPDPPPPGSPGA